MIRITKVKVHANGKVEVHDQKDVDNDGLKDLEENKRKSTITPHPDLQLALDGLKPFLAECYGLNYADEYTTAEGIAKDKQDAFKIVKPILRREYNSVLNDITITGLTVHGTTDKIAVVISGIKMQPNKSKTSLNSPHIKLESKYFGFEVALSHAVDVVLMESEMYHTGKKKAQFDIFDSAELNKSQNLEVA